MTDQPSDDGGMTDEELNQLLTTANRELLDHLQRVADPDATLTAILAQDAQDQRSSAIPGRYRQSLSGLARPALLTSSPMPSTAPRDLDSALDLALARARDRDRGLDLYLDFDSVPSTVPSTRASDIASDIASDLNFVRDVASDSVSSLALAPATRPRLRQCL